MDRMIVRLQTFVEFLGIGAGHRDGLGHLEQLQGAARRGTTGKRRYEVEVDQKSTMARNEEGIVEQTLAQLLHGDAQSVVTWGVVFQITDIRIVGHGFDVEDAFGDNLQDSILGIATQQADRGLTVVQHRNLIGLSFLQELVDGTHLVEFLLQPRVAEAVQLQYKNEEGDHGDLGTHLQVIDDGKLTSRAIPSLRERIPREPRY